MMSQKVVEKSKLSLFPAALRADTKYSRVPGRGDILPIKMASRGRPSGDQWKGGGGGNAHESKGGYSS